MRRDEALAILTSHHRELKALRVRSLAIFGSTARDEARPESDVDVLVELERPVGLFGFIELRQYLEGLLGRPVDLVTPDALKRQPRDEILNEAVYAA